MATSVIHWYFDPDFVYALVDRFLGKTARRYEHIYTDIAEHGLVAGFHLHHYDHNADLTQGPALPIFA